VVRRIPVSSSAVVSVGYDAGTRTLEVEFVGGGLYRYSRVPRRVFDGLLSADSVGAYVTMHVKPHYPYTRVG
jgi:hypothetical protein